MTTSVSARSRSILPVTGSNAPPRLFMATRRAEPGGAIRLVLAGELDLAALPYLEAALDSAQSDSGRVLLDLNALTLIDCAGIAAIFAAAQRARRRGAVLILLDPHGQVRRLLLDLVGPPVGVGVLDRDDLPERVGPVAA